MDLLQQVHVFFVPREKSAIKRRLVLCYILLLVLFVQWTSCPFGIYPKPKSSSNVFKQATVKNIMKVALGLMGTHRSCSNSSYS